MTVQELNREQLDELKVSYVFDKFDELGECPAYSDILNATKIPDEVMFEVYAGVNFVEEDFFCSKEEA